jgi:tetratricopeptide (TPR) repeat protein
VTGPQVVPLAFLTLTVVLLIAPAVRVAVREGPLRIRLAARTDAALLAAPIAIALALAFGERAGATLGLSVAQRRLDRADLDGAERAYRLACYLGANMSRCYQARAEIAERRGAWSDSLVAYRAWGAESPGDPRPHLRAGWVQFTRGDYTAAAQAFTQSAERGAGPLADAALGMTAYAVGNDVLALSKFQAWRTATAGGFDPIFWTGIAAARTGDWIAAAAHLRTALDRRVDGGAGDVSTAWAILGTAYERLGQNTEASDARRQAASAAEGSSPDVLLSLDAASLASARASVRHRLALPGTVGGPRPSTPGLLLDESSRLSLPPSSADSARGSIALWARLDDEPAEHATLWRANENNDLYGYREPGGAFTAFFGGHKIGRTGLTVLDREWHHYAFSWNEEGQKFFIDGRLSLSGDASGAPSTINRVAIGWLGSRSGEQWRGSMTEIATFSRALSADEWLAVFRHGLSGGGTSTIPWPRPRRLRS